jgi:hypothetical protein
LGFLINVKGGCIIEIASLHGDANFFNLQGKLKHVKRYSICCSNNTKSTNQQMAH